MHEYLSKRDSYAYMQWGWRADKSTWVGVTIQKSSISKWIISPQTRSNWKPELSKWYPPFRDQFDTLGFHEGECAAELIEGALHCGSAIHQALLGSPTYNSVIKSATDLPNIVHIITITIAWDIITITNAWDNIMGSKVYGLQGWWS